MGKINGCSVVVNTSNDEKQVCSVHHGVHKNSYSPCGGWYNASTGPLVALVTQCFDTFCVGIWPKMVKIKKKMEVDNFDIVCYISTGGYSMGTKCNICEK